MSLPDRRFNLTFSDSGDQLDLTFADESTEVNADFGQTQRITVETDYNRLVNKPQINGVELSGNKTTEDLGIDPLPADGQVGDVLMLGSSGAVWETPANHAEEDNTRPITSAAVYTEIGNINALLATI